MVLRFFEFLLFVVFVEIRSIFIRFFTLFFSRSFNLIAVYLNWSFIGSGSFFLPIFVSMTYSIWRNSDLFLLRFSYVITCIELFLPRWKLLKIVDWSQSFKVKIRNWNFLFFFWSWYLFITIIHQNSRLSFTLNCNLARYNNKKNV